MQLIRLCDDPNLVGLRLLENLTTVPLRDLNCSMTHTDSPLCQTMAVTFKLNVLSLFLQLLSC